MFRQHLGAHVALLAFLPHLGAGTDDGEFADRLHRWIEFVQESFAVPGLAVGVVQEGEVVFARGYGVASVDDARPITPRSLFHMASVSKPFVATALLQLDEYGDLSLDDDPARHLPYFAMDDPRVGAVTVRRMLNHTSGIPDTNDYGWDRPELDDGALERYVRSLRPLALDFAPGERWSYSNVAYEVLGDVIAKVSGQSFEAFVAEEILDPLGMDDSTFLRADVPPELATAPHRWRLTPAVSDIYPYHRAHAPSSTLHSNVYDMCRWIRVHLEGGELDGARILAEATVTEMWTAGPRTSIGGRAMGLGWFVGERHGRRSIWHGGGDTGYRTWLEILPDDDAGVVVLSNYDEGSPVQLVADATVDLLLGRGEIGTVVPPVRYAVGRVLARDGVEAALARWDELARERPS